MIETIYIVGPASAGKSEFAGALSAALAQRTRSPWPVGDTSWPLYKWLAELCAAAPWPGPEHANVAAWLDYILARKEQHRPMLVKLADIARQIDPCYFHSEAKDVEGTRILVGIRKRLEIPGTSALTPDSYPTFSQFIRVRGKAVIYVDRPDFPSVDDGFDKEFFKAIAHHTVVNRGGDVAGLKIQAQMLAEELGK